MFTNITKRDRKKKGLSRIHVISNIVESLIRLHFIRSLTWHIPTMELIQSMQPEMRPRTVNLVYMIRMVWISYSIVASNRAPDEKELQE